MTNTTIAPVARPTGSPFPRIAHQPETLADRAVDEIRQLIEDGRLPVGERLPSERELVGLLGISRTILREALSSLEALGFVERRSTRGRFVAAGGPSSRSRALIGAWLHQHAAEIAELDEVRGLIERHALLALAPDQAPALASRLAAVLDDQEHAVERADAGRAAAADSDFHKLLCASSPNATLLDLALALVDRSKQISLAAYALPDLARLGLAEHRAIADQLAHGDVPAAADLLRAHIDSSSTRNLRTGADARTSATTTEPTSQRRPRSGQKGRR